MDEGKKSRKEQAKEAEGRETQERITKLHQFYRRHRRMPSYGEMMKLFGYRSKSATYYFVKKLLLEGVVARDMTGKLVPKRLSETKILGLVEAGFPTSASEELADTMSLDEYLVEKKEASYLLRVKGDSMIEAGIMPGDLVIVERGREPRVGDIVVALIDGEYTLKYFRRKAGKVFLEAGNSAYKPIYPKQELEISAVVRAVVRKYD